MLAANDGASSRVRGGANPAGPAPFAQCRSPCLLIMPSTAAGSLPGYGVIEMAAATHGSVARSFGCAVSRFPAHQCVRIHPRAAFGPPETSSRAEAISVGNA